MTDLEKAKALLKSGNYGNCVLYSNEIIHTSNGRGITPMLEFLTAGLDLKGFSAADTIVGKAAALLFAFAGVKEVYADVMSQSAVNVFSRFEIRCIYEKLVEKIQNRDGDDICPMERAVENINQPEQAFETLRKILKM
ncbi:MAG: DUF1893 domain-containing protein [Oscillospiraceae bacterium]|nr:DUF1893 domain-containing protein [Oscillospiraceae bacterium]